MKKPHMLILASCSALALAGCGADDVVAPNGPITVNPNPAPSPTPTPTPAPGSETVTAAPASACTGVTTDGGIITLQNGRGTIRECKLPNNLSGTVSLTAKRADGVMYSIDGITNVGTDVSLPGGGTAATLNVSPGVTVFAKSRESAIIVKRGSKLNADGTEALPIIFTAEANLTGVVSGGGSLTDTSDNLWGGIILTGRAPISDCVSPGGGSTVGGSAGCWRKAEGTPTDVFYGGDIANDNSGILNYVQVNFTGVGTGGSEIQGVTTAGVGSDTVISYVQVHNSRDDGLESFGGRQNMDHLIFTGNSDDSFDTDYGYQGRTQFLLAVRRAAGTDGDDPDGETIFEIDSSSNATATPQQMLKVANFTLIQSTPNEPVMRLRGGADIELYNGVVVAKNTGTATGCLDVDNDETVTANRPIIRSVLFDCQTVIHPDSDTLEAQALGLTNNTAETSKVSSLLFLNASGTSIGRIANGTVESTLIPATLPAGFQQVNYIGALSGPGDTWTLNWTCNSDVANLGGRTSCLDIRVF